MFEEQLNECYEPVSICGYNYDQGRALRLLDEVAFRCGVSEWEGEEFDELHFDDLTESEQEYYIATERSVMYVRKDENNIDDEEE